ncbi:hypothetical protein ACO1O0_007904 [Amphichorda felina]
MAPTLYDVTVVYAQAVLRAMDHIITEGEKHPNSASFPQARLHEDMKPLAFQAGGVSYFAERMLARLTGEEPAEFKGEVASFADMHARIAHTLEALAKADKDTINRKGEEVQATELPVIGVVDVNGSAFAMGAVMPNLVFHLSIAYAILRKEGVPLGKQDFIAEFSKEYILKP